MYAKIIEFLKRESFTIFIICVAILLMIATSIHFVLPSYYKMCQNYDKLISYQALTSSNDGYTRIKQEIKKKNIILRERVNALSASSTDYRDLSLYLEMLISKATMSDIQFIKMQPQTETKTSDFILSPVLIDLTTTYHALGQFISSIEKLPHIFKVERLAMESKNSGKLETKILVTCYIPSWRENES